MTYTDDIVALDQHLSSYCHAIDCYRLGGYVEHFTPDATLEVAWQDAKGQVHPLNAGAGCLLRGRSQILRFVQHVFAGLAPLPRLHTGPGHQLVSRLIEVSGETAELRAVHADGSFQYEIEAVHTPDGWRFNKIRILYGEDQSLPATADGPLDEALSRMSSGETRAEDGEGPTREERQ
jgi:SnoaL-like domain